MRWTVAKIALRHWREWQDNCSAELQGHVLSESAEVAGIILVLLSLPPRILLDKGGFDSMTDQLRDHAAGRRQEIVDSMQGELELALTFVEVSSNAYGRGKLQRAIDARSRAEAVQTRAIAELIESATPDPEASHSLRSKLAAVGQALAHLPSSSERFHRVRRAG